MSYRNTTQLMAFSVCLLTAMLSGLIASPALAQSSRDASVGEFNETAGGIEQRLIDSEAELGSLIESITEQKLPLNTELRQLEDELAEARKELEKFSRTAAVRALEEEKLKKTIEEREKAASFIANRFDEYIREFEAGLHIAEIQRYENVLEDAKLAMENRDLSTRDRFDVQLAVIESSLERLVELQGGAIYQGSAIDGAGVLGQQGASVTGTFVQLGPVVVFSDATGKLQGTVVQKVGALLPEVVPFNMPEDAQAVKRLVESAKGELPLDATLGEALTVESIEDETLEDEIKAGGFVMWPLGIVAGLAVLIALYKFVSIVFTPSPSRRKLEELLHAVAEHNLEKARRVAKTMRGPSGKMLQAGADHLGAPRELIEEVMYEKVLKAKLQVQRALPFIAICAAAAPLLGLLGTVSGIINTFKMMQISGGSDMQNVSGGISEALITTKYGLIVAIPALILHVFLSRMARNVIDQMEKSGVAFINQVMKATPGDGERAAALPEPAPDEDSPSDQPEPSKKTDDSQQESGQQVAEDAEQHAEEKSGEGEQKPELVETGTK